MIGKGKSKIFPKYADRYLICLLQTEGNSPTNWRCQTKLQMSKFWNVGDSTQVCILKGYNTRSKGNPFFLLYITEQNFQPLNIDKMACLLV